MPETKTIELPIAGMDCAECASHVQRALSKVAGVTSAEVLLSAEKARVRLDPAQADAVPDLGILANSSRLLRQRALLSDAPAPAPATRRAVPTPLVPVSQGGAEASTKRRKRRSKAR